MVRVSKYSTGQVTQPLSWLPEIPWMEFAGVTRSGLNKGQKTNIFMLKAAGLHPDTQEFIDFVAFIIMIYKFITIFFQF